MTAARKERSGGCLDSSKSSDSRDGMLWYVSCQGNVYIEQPEVLHGAYILHWPAEASKTDVPNHHSSLKL